MVSSINSLVWATDIDVLAADHTLQRRDRYWVVQSPKNPTFWWGNFLLFDDAPGPGDGERWQALFAQEFADRPEVTHRTLAWDRLDGQHGDAEQELVARGYELESSAGLIATPQQLAEHPAANRDAEIRRLDPAGDERLWEGVIEVQMATAREEGRELEDGYHRTFLERRQRELREIFLAGRGGWYIALLDGEIAGSLGVVVTDRRARYQTVDTVERFRRRGVARRLVFDAARDACSHYDIDHLVIVADPEYHAISVYEGLGFDRVEQVVGAIRKPERS
jgi:ribosomal protein S18 acetylase RimI-like enzyme